MKFNLRIFLICFSFNLFSITMVFAAQPRNINMESYFPAPYGWYQNLNVNNSLDATNAAKNVVVKADVIKFTNHLYPITPDGSCSAAEEFNTVLAGANLHICWKYISVVPGSNPPVQTSSFEWTPAPFSNWSYNSLKNTVFTLPLTLNGFLPNVGVGTGSDVRGNFEIRGTTISGAAPAASALTTLLMSNLNSDQSWGIAVYYLNDDPLTPAVEQDFSTFTINTAIWPVGSGIVGNTEVFRINYARRFGFNSMSPRGLYSFDRVSNSGWDSMLLSGIDLNFEYTNPTPPINTPVVVPPIDSWRITNISPLDTGGGNRPLIDALNFVAYNNSAESYALTLWQDKNQNNVTRVGIGTPFPQADLHVAGFGPRTFFLHNGFTTQDIARISFRNGGSSSNIAGTENSYIQVKSDGKIGINTVNANEALSVLGNISLGSLTNDYAVSSPFQLVLGQKAGMRIVSGQVNVSNNGATITALGNDYSVQRQSAGVYRIQFTKAFATNQIFTTVTLVAPNGAITPGLLPITPLVRVSSQTQVVVTLIGPTGNAVDFSFFFHSVGSRK